MQRAVESGVDKAAWSVAAHLGNKDLGTWMAFYPSGFQPTEIAASLKSCGPARGCHPSSSLRTLPRRLILYNLNGAIEPRIPGIFQYYVAGGDRARPGVRG